MSVPKFKIKILVLFWDKILGSSAYVPFFPASLIPLNPFPVSRPKSLKKKKNINSRRKNKWSEVHSNLDYTSTSGRCHWSYSSCSTKKQALGCRTCEQRGDFRASASVAACNGHELDQWWRWSISYSYSLS